MFAILFAERIVRFFTFFVSYRGNIMFLLALINLCFHCLLDILDFT